MRKQNLAEKFEDYILEGYELETLDNADSIELSTQGDDLELWIAEVYGSLIPAYSLYSRLLTDSSLRGSVGNVANRLKRDSISSDLVPLSDVVNELIGVFQELDQFKDKQREKKFQDALKNTNKKYGKTLKRLA